MTTRQKTLGILGLLIFIVVILTILARQVPSQTDGKKWTIEENFKEKTYMVYHDDSVTIYNCGSNRDTTVTISDEWTFKEFFNQ